MISKRSPLPARDSGAPARASSAGRASSAARDSTAQASLTAREVRSSLTAREVHERLRAALAELQRAERNAVLWFSEIARRKLYRDLGYASIHQYAELALGFKKSKTSQFLRLSECLKELPGLRRSVAKGELSWTKAREVAKVATPETETVWIREAKQASSRALEAKVMETRKRARRAGSAVRGKWELMVPAASSSSGVSGSESSGAVLPGTVSSGSASANSTSGPVPSDDPGAVRAPSGPDRGDPQGRAAGGSCRAGPGRARTAGALRP